ncbi:pyrophosphohydrolase domain-containing protein [Agromyces cerinus]|uniref:NTP pyrophosphatase, house-cleaning of non-canonical NTPs n=1 Tax=Agromyces cerinus subsp. cerinus TaxID=232089 RepID=A0A1N6GL78_9MICO|nr:MazG nucleotide pyrophosphohydrolase domain-containing protein [Agromyces cerinus]SIO08308.1 NTP pyrophosphatase, house-cleaning of non-canonical NTPs [Agromyces cerinus subsp. cerinus]
MDLHAIEDAVESVSRAYAAKFDLNRTDEWFMLKLQEEVGELTQVFVDLNGMGRDRGLSDDDKREAFANECADVLAHLLLLARSQGIDLPRAIEAKWLSWDAPPTSDEGAAGHH